MPASGFANGSAAPVLVAGGLLLLTLLLAGLLAGALAGRPRRWLGGLGTVPLLVWLVLGVYLSRRFSWPGLWRSYGLWALLALLLQATALLAPLLARRDEEPKLWARLTARGELLNLLPGLALATAVLLLDCFPNSSAYAMTLAAADQWLAGIWQSLWLVALALLLGLFIAVPGGVLLASRAHWLWKAPMALFSYVFRGTPMLVQLYLFYYGFGLTIGTVPGIKDSSLWPLLKAAGLWALIAFALNTAAYTSEIVRGAVATTPPGEIEAGRAFGMGRGQILRRIILPSALRRALPSYGNEIIFMLHGSAIASVVTLLDLTGVAKKIYSNYYEPFVPFLTAGFLYLYLTSLLVFAFRRLEWRFNRHL